MPSSRHYHHTGMCPASDRVSLSSSTASPDAVNAALLMKRVFEAGMLKASWEAPMEFPSFAGYAVHAPGDGTVYAGTLEKLRCLDGETGQVKWEKKLPMYFGRKNDSYLAQGTLFIVISDVNKSDNDRLKVLDASDGSEKWERTINRYDLFRVTDEGDVYLRMKNGYLLLDGSDGSEKMRVQAEEEKETTSLQVAAMNDDGTALLGSREHIIVMGPRGELLWRDKGSALTGSAWFSRDRLVMSGPDGRLHARASATGRTLWSADIAGLTAGTLSDTCLYASQIYDLHCLDLSDGHQKWMKKGACEEYSALKAIGADNIPYVARGNRIEALDPETGEPLWSLVLPAEQLERRGTALLTEKRGLLLCDTERIYMIDSITGLIMQQFSAGDGTCITSFTVSPDGRLLVEVSRSNERSRTAGKLLSVDLREIVGDLEEAGNEAAPGGHAVEETDEWIIIDEMRLSRKRQ